MEGIATLPGVPRGKFSIIIEVVDLVWKGLRLAWAAFGAAFGAIIEVVDLVWKGLRQLGWILRGLQYPIEVVDLVWKGLRQVGYT